MVLKYITSKKEKIIKTETCAFANVARKIRDDNQGFAIFETET